MGGFEEIIINIVMIMIFILFFIAGTVLLMILLSFFGKSYSMKKLEYKRYFSEKGEFEGEEVMFIEELTNHSFLPMFRVYVETHITSNIKLKGCEDDDGSNQHFISLFFVMPYTRIKRVHSAVLKKRGHYYLETAKVIFMGIEAFVESKAEISVYPSEIKPEEKLNINSSLAYSSQSRIPLITDVFSFSGIREYRSGDNFSLINHKATAKSNFIMVNNHDYIMGRKIIVYINFQNGDKDIQIDKFYLLIEKALSYASYIAGEAYKNGWLFGLRSNSKMQDGKLSYSSEISTGRTEYMEALDSLACMRNVYGHSINLVLDKDIDDFLEKSEVFIFTVYTDDSIERRINILEKMGNVVNLIDFSEVERG